MIENIVSVFERATPAEVEAGINWYPTAHRIALEISNGDLERGAGVIAALSPMQKWDRNIELARIAFATGNVTGGLKRNCAKANAIVAGANPLDVLGGEKVLSFYANIVNPQGDAITIDRHAIDIALGRVHTDATRPSMSKGRYAEFFNAYLDAAKRCGVFPLELQAITWVTWRREKGIK